VKQSPVFVVFRAKSALKSSKGNPFYGSVKYTYTMVGKYAFFDQIATYLGNGAR